LLLLLLLPVFWPTPVVEEEEEEEGEEERAAARAWSLRVASSMRLSWAREEEGRKGVPTKAVGRKGREGGREGERG
jgi:hypothetical protein